MRAALLFGFPIHPCHLSPILCGCCGEPCSGISCSSAIVTSLSMLHQAAELRPEHPIFEAAQAALAADCFASVACSDAAGAANESSAAEVSSSSQDRRGPFRNCPALHLSTFPLSGEAELPAAWASASADCHFPHSSHP